MLRLLLLPLLCEFALFFSPNVRASWSLGEGDPLLRGELLLRPEELVLVPSLDRGMPPRCPFPPSNSCCFFCQLSCNASWSLLESRFELLLDLSWLECDFSFDCEGRGSSDFSETPRARKFAASWSFRCCSFSEERLLEPFPFFVVCDLLRLAGCWRTTKAPGFSAPGARLCTTRSRCACFFRFCALARALARASADASRAGGPASPDIDP